MADSSDDRTGLSDADPWVLVVEDDAKFADVLRRFLASAGYTTRRAFSGDTALRALLAPGAIAVLLDVMIPHPDGIEVCRQLRRTRWGGPIIAMSARSGPRDRAAIAAAGADRFLAKPFPLEDLADAIRSLTGPAPVLS